MKVFQTGKLFIAAVILIIAGCLWSARVPAMAGTTGTITGTVRDAESGAPVGNVRVTATAASGSQSTTTNSTGFYSLQALIPDTYTVAFQVSGYNAGSQAGVTVQQDLISKIDMKITKTLKEIGRVTTRSAGNLVKPYEGTDVYNVSAEQLNAATGGDNLHRTIYEYLNTVPGVSPIGGGFPAEPSIRGGYDVDNGYELDGIPITERMTGFFTTNLTDLGTGNVEVYTGGLGAANAGNGVGVINSVIKTGKYPSFGNIAAGITSPDFNHSFRAEYGGASIDKRLSYYLAVDSINSQNDFNYGTAAFNLVQTGVNSFNPGYIATRDVIGNFHYKPNGRNDFQFLYQNSLFNDGVNYALNSGTSTAPLLSLQPCKGVQPSNFSNSGGAGGVAPNGAPCPEGLYFGALPNGSGNFLGHYSAIGKIQWNHIINDHSSFALRLAENFNQYIFDQKLTDPNDPQFNCGPTSRYCTGPGTLVSSKCPQYPYAAGSPLPQFLNRRGHARQCTFDLGDYYQSRYGNDYYLSLDYTATPNENLTFKAGIGQEYDNQKRDVRYLNDFNASATSTFPASLTDIPVHVPFIYAQASINKGPFTFQPGLRYQRIYYSIPANPQIVTPIQPNGVPGGVVSTGFLAPSFLGTYRINTANALRYSYATTAQFIGTEFVYRYGSTTYNPFYIPANAPPNTYKPTVNTSFDLQLEHQFDANTSMKVGPYYRFSNNYLAIYSPVTLTPGGAPKYGDQQVTNDLKIRSFGVELGVSHLDKRATGASWWLSGSLNNYWSQVSFFGQTSFINFPIADYFRKQNVFVRSPYVPPFSATLVADVHSHGLHFIPDIYYTFGNFYNTGGCVDLQNAVPINEYMQNVDCTSDAATMTPGGAGVNPVMAPERHGMAYWKVNTTLVKELGNHYSVGLRVTNLTDAQSDYASGTIPCFNAPDPARSDGAGTGCGSFNGPRSGTPPQQPSYIYQNLTNDPRRIEFFVNYKM
ncbi:MAG: TonB-dependent receptor [Candidatus Eremiobacteraeota bacterium]|nr:TonB-dependent receptor [Candidatus Eremiobacteraeota bacterium]